MLNPLRKCNAAGRKIAEEFESLELYAYPDPGSPLSRQCARLGIKARDYAEINGWQKLPGDPWTIGYGHTGPEVKPGLCITQTTADSLLESDMAWAEHTVNQLAANNGITGNEFSALCDLAFNIGCHNFERSSALALVNADRLDLVPDHIKLWDKDHAGNVLGGLQRRRQADADLFVMPDAS